MKIEEQNVVRVMKVYHGIELIFCFVNLHILSYFFGIIRLNAGFSNSCEIIDLAHNSFHNMSLVSAVLKRVYLMCA